MNGLIRFAVPVLSLVAIAACNKDRDRDVGARNEERARSGIETDREKGTTTTTGANAPIANQTAVSRIVGARCAREATCNNVGADKRFTTREVCTQKVGADMKDDLNAKDCPAGVDSKELNECLDAIAKEDCNNPIDTISRLAACRTSDLCLKTGAPNR